MTYSATVAAPQAMEAFTFGDPEAVLDRRELFDYFECNLIHNEWYEMPISADGLSRMLRAGVHHASAIQFKAQVLASTFKPHPMLSRSTMLKVCKDYLVFANAYLEQPRNVLGSGMQLTHSLAKYTRRHRDLQRFGFMPKWNEVHTFRRGSICHIMDPDVDQEVYGVVPGNSAGFGNVVNAARVFARNEIQPLQTHLAAAINDFAGEEICRFDTYRLPGVDEPQAQELK